MTKRCFQKLYRTALFASLKPKQHSHCVNYYVYAGMTLAPSSWMNSARAEELLFTIRTPVRSRAPECDLSGVVQRTRETRPLDTHWLTGFAFLSKVIDRGKELQREVRGVLHLDLGHINCRTIKPANKNKNKNCTSSLFAHVKTFSRTPTSLILLISVQNLRF